jgi:hypothetical protein
MTMKGTLNSDLLTRYFSRACFGADAASRKGHERDLGTKLGDRIGVKLRLAEHRVGVLAETGSPPSAGPATRWSRKPKRCSIRSD